VYLGHRGALVVHEEDPALGCGECPQVVVERDVHTEGGPRGERAGEQQLDVPEHAGAGVHRGEALLDHDR
jgi:hypothetical protein